MSNISINTSNKKVRKHKGIFHNDYLSVNLLMKAMTSRKMEARNR